MRDICGMSGDDEIPKGSLPPPRKGAKPRPCKRAKAAPADDIPSCGLPKPKRATRKAKPATVAVPGEEWDAAKEAAAARAAVARKRDAGSGKEFKAEAPPKLSKRKRDAVAHEVTSLIEPKAKPDMSATEAREEMLKRMAETTAREIAEARAADAVPVDDELFFDVCAMMSRGMTISRICERPGMPTRWAIARFLNDASDPDRQAARLAHYARARILGFDCLAEETLDIADDATNDYVERKRDDGTTEVVLDREHIARSKLRVDTRMKLLSVWDRKRYGDQLALSDPNGEALGTGAARERSVSDMAIGVAKIMEAAKRQHGGEPALIEGKAQ